MMVYGVLHLKRCHQSVRELPISHSFSIENTYIAIYRLNNRTHNICLDVMYLVVE
jgi:hypothetical protein